MNWGECKAGAQTYTHRKDLDYDFLQNQACDRMTQALDVMENESITSGLLSTTANELGLYSIDLVDDFGRMKTVKINGDEYRSTSLINLSNEDGARYAISGGKLYVKTTGTAAYAYGRQIDPIASDDATNQILTRYPRVYVYALVIEAFIQCQDFDAASGYQSAFEGAVDDANGLQAFSRFDSGASVKTGFGRV